MFDVDLDTLRKSLLGSSPVNFSYFKLDGKCRQAIGTLHQDLIPEKNRITKSKDKKKKENFSYFDLEKKAWRSLHKDCTQVTIIE